MEMHYQPVPIAIVFQPVQFIIPENNDAYQFYMPKYYVL